MIITMGNTLQLLIWTLARGLYRLLRVLPLGSLLVILAEKVRSHREKAHAREWSLRAVDEDLAFNQSLIGKMTNAIAHSEPLPRTRFRTATYHYFYRDRHSPVSLRTANYPSLFILHQQLDELNGYLESLLLGEHQAGLVDPSRSHLSLRLRQLCSQFRALDRAFSDHLPSSHPPL